MKRKNKLHTNDVKVLEIQPVNRERFNDFGNSVCGVCVGEVCVGCV